MSTRHVLISNDDGIDAHGIGVLESTVRAMDGFRVSVVAPSDQQSASSHSLTLTLDEGALLEYRIGRGTLANTEKLDPDDRFANHELLVPEGQESITVEIVVNGWWDQ